MTSTNLAGIVGRIAIGTGQTGSKGNIENGNDLGAALNEVAVFARSCGHMIDVEVKAGLYENRTPFSITDAPLNVMMSPGARVVSKITDANSIAFGRIAVDEARVRGGTFIYPKHVAGQIGIKVEPKDGTQVEGVVIDDGQHVFEQNTPEAWDEDTETTKDSTAQVAVDLTQLHAGRISNNVVLPNRGVIGIRGTNGKSNIYDGNIIRAGTLLYLAAIPDVQRRVCYVGIDLNAETLLSVSRCKVTDQGEVADTNRRAGHALRVRFPNVAKSTYEYGHLKINNCEFEDVLSTGPTVLIRGCRWGQYARNVHCFNGVATEVGSGFLALMDSVGDGSGSNHIVQPFEIQACEFHNPGTTDAASIYMRSCKNVSVLASVFYENFAAQAVYVDSRAAGYDVEGIYFKACTAVWPTSTPGTRHFMKRAGTTATAKDLYLDVLAATGASGTAVTGLFTGTGFSGKHVIKGIAVDSTSVQTASDIGLGGYLFGT